MSQENGWIQTDKFSFQWSAISKQLRTTKYGFTTPARWLLQAFVSFKANSEVSIAIPFSFESTIKKLRMLSLSSQALKCGEESGNHTCRTPAPNVSIDRPHPWFFSLEFWEKGAAYTQTFMGYMYLLNTSQLSNVTVGLQVNGTAIRLHVDTQADIIIIMERHLKECSILPCSPPV